MATTRLRKTFKYPDDPDSGSDVSHDELDEEGQEKLIATLRAKEVSTNAQYTLIFSVLPLLVILPFVYYLFNSSSTRLIALLCVLAITSLLGSAYTVRFVPLDAARASSLATQKARLRASTSMSSLVSPDGPLITFLPYLNSTIAALLCIASWRVRSKDTSPEGFWLFLLLPAVVLAMITVARRSMADVDAGIGELSRLRYDYRGA